MLEAQDFPPYSLFLTLLDSYSLLSTGKRAYKQSRRGCHLFPPDLLEDTKRSQYSVIQRLVFTGFPLVLL